MIRVNFLSLGIITIMLVTIFLQSHSVYASDITNINDILLIFDRITWEFTVDQIKQVFPNREWAEFSLRNAKSYFFLSKIDNEVVSIHFVFTNDGELFRIGIPFLFVDNATAKVLCKKYLRIFKQHYGDRYHIGGYPSKGKDFSYMWRTKDSIIFLGINPEGQLTIHKIRKSKALYRFW